MAAINSTCTEVVKKLLKDQIPIKNFVEWLLNTKDCAQYHEIIDDNKELLQFQFIAWFLNDLRTKASLVISERKSKIGISSVASSPNLAQNEEYGSNNEKKPVFYDGKLERSEEAYFEEFPGLMEFPSKKSHKSHRRIKPTSIQTDGKYFYEKQSIEPVNVTADTSSVSFPFDFSKEELLIQRFSKKKKIKKTTYSVLDISSAFENKCGVNSSKINDSSYTHIDKLVNLYCTLVSNFLVPNVSYEIRFILNLFDQLTECGISFHTKTNMSNDISFLNSVHEWEYFCVHVIIQLEPMISKLDSNTLKFLANRLQLLKMEVPTSFSSNNGDIISAQAGLKFCSKIFNSKKMVVEDFSTESDFILICDQEKKMLEIEKNYYGHRSDIRLGEEIKALLKVSSQTTWFYFLGKHFVCSLVKKIEDQIINRSDCEQKLAQLNTRLTKPSQSNEHESEISFNSNELFFKLWLDYCLLECPLFIHYVKYWLIFALSALTKDTYKELVDSLCPDKRNTHLWTLKVKVILAKFLGYVEFYFNRHNYKLNGNEKKQLISIQSEMLPAFDLKKYLLEAIKNGILILTVPWIVEFLSMADSISALVYYYHDVLFMLTTFYLSNCIRHKKDGSKGSNFRKEILKTSILIPQRPFDDENSSNIEGITIFLNITSFKFLLIWIGRLFDNKILGESLFFDIAFSYSDKLSQAKFRNLQGNWKTMLDCADFVKRDMFILNCPFFSKMKYWENSSTGYIRSIRPMSLDSENIQGSSVNIQDMLENSFLSHHQSLASLISFVSERIAEVCQNEISPILPSSKFTLQSQVNIVNMKNGDDPIDSCSLDAEINSTPCDPLHTMKPKIMEVINSCETKIMNSFSLLAPPGLSSNVIKTCVTITSKQFKRHIINWLVYQGYKLDYVEDFIITNSVDSCEVNDELGKNSLPLPFNTSLSLLFSEIHRLIREMNQHKLIAHSFYSALEKFNLISKQLQEINEKKLLKDLYILSWDYVLLLVCNYDNVIPDIFLTQMITFWKENHCGNNEERILCPRTIKEASVKKKELQAIIAKNLAKLILLSLKDNIISAECFETQNVAVLRYTWTKVELLFIKMYMVTVCEYLKSSILSTPRLLSMLECIVDSVDDILSLES